MTDREGSAPGAQRWRRFGLRVLASYFVLYTAPVPLNHIPWLGHYLMAAAEWFWKWLGPWVGHHVFGIQGEIFTGATGSGDTTLDYLLIPTRLAMALAIAGVWTALRWRRSPSPRLAQWLVVWVRYYLGIVMLGYGLAKAIPAQMPYPSLQRLLTSYGDSSPMGLVWTFIGASPAYSVVTGLAEIIGGVLLFFRRTRLAGALWLITVLVNVVAINFCYDVPVKLYSLHLLLMAVGLALLDGRRLLAFFVLGKPAAAPEQPPLFRRRSANIAGRVVSLLLVGYVIVTGFTEVWQVYTGFGDGRERPPLWGIHDVETFISAGEELPASLTDETRWRALVVDRPLPMTVGEFSRPGRISIWHMNGEFSHHPVVLDAEAKTLTILPPPESGQAEGGDPPAGEVLHYERPTPDTLLLTGTWQGSPVEIRLKERDLKSMNLPGRGYHWINELPFNR